MGAATALAGIGGDRARDALIARAIDGEIQWVRDAATAALGAWEGEAIATVLLRRARSAREEVDRIRAIEAAGRLAPLSLAAAFRPWVHHKEPVVAAAAVTALGRMCANTEEITAEEADAVLSLLEHPLRLRAERKHSRAYAAAIDALGTVAYPDARTKLVEELLLLPDEDAYVPARIAMHVRSMETAEAVAAIESAAADLPARQAEPRRRILRLVGDAGLTSLASFLIGSLRGSGDDVTGTAIRSLGLVGAVEVGVPALRTVLQDHGTASVRSEALIALARLLEPAAFRGLWEIVLADRDADVRRQFVVEINDHDDPAGIPVLASFVRDEDWRVASAAIAAVGTLGVASDLPLLEPLARHRDWKIRAATYEAMGRLRAAQAIPRLTFGLEDRDPVVRGVCHANLQILSREEFGPEPKRWRRWWQLHGDTVVLRKRSRMTPEEREAEEAERSKARYEHDRYRFGRRHGIEILQKARILVVSGAWDHVEVVLGHLDIPHTLLRAQELKEAGLNPNQVVLVNCEGNLDKDAQERLRWFVNVGGYLMTTDWALTKTVDTCFPGYLAQFSGSSTGNDVVVVEETPPGHPFTEGVFEDVPALKWWLEVRAFPITVTWPERCDVIVDSAEMRSRYGSSTMATVFRWGLGKVQHSVSHFQLQEEGMQQASKPRDRMVFAADNLGLSLAQIRDIASRGGFEGPLNEQTMREIAPDYSMFRLIVNVVKEKSDWVEGL
jgi:HEAT repeat protein